MTSTLQDPLALGSTLNESYSILRVIGRGGMGVVYEAQHTRLPQRLAIKVIRGNADRQSIDRFRREAEIASSLGHPNIMRVFDFNVLANGTPYMVMDYLEGMDLEDALKTGMMDVNRVLAISRQVGSALMAAHESGIVHRDLKPSNIFLTMRELAGEVAEHVMVLDFGISKVQDSSTVVTQTHALIGTPQYMAPEQAMGHHDRITPKTDQFSLASVIYVMLSGVRPFPGERLHEVVYKVCHTEPTDLGTLLPDLDRDLIAAIRRAMSKQPSDRFDSVGDFIEALTGRPLAILPRSKLRSRPELAAPSFATEETILSVEQVGAAPTIASMPDARVSMGTAATIAHRPASEPSTPHKKSYSETMRPTFDARTPHAGVLRLPRESKSAAPPTASSPPPSESTSPQSEIASAKKNRSKWLLWVPMVIAAAGGAAVAIAVSGSSAGDGANVARKPAAVAVADAAIAIAPADATPQAAVADAAALHGPADAGASASSADAAGATRTPHKTPPQPRSPKTSPELEEARAALKAGQFARARKLADRAYRASKSKAAFAIKVMAFCGEGNFGTAKDWFARVPRSQRAEVRRYCDKHDISL